MSNREPNVCTVLPGKTQDLFLVVPVAGCTRHRLLSRLRGGLPSVPWQLCESGVQARAIPLVRALGTPSQMPVPARWEPESDRMFWNRLRLLQCHARVADHVNYLLSGGYERASAALLDNPDTAVLDKHQVVNVACMVAPGGYGLPLFDEQGAGKTVTAIYCYDTLVQRDEADKLLIVAPKSMVGEWPADIARFVGDRYRVSVVAGTRQEKREAVSADADIFITNFETVRSMEDELRLRLSRTPDRSVLVIDESYYVKNAEARRCLAVRRIREWCGRAYVLCGTPAPNHPKDLVEQFNIVDFGCTFDGIDVPDDREQARPVVSNALEGKSAYLRNLKAEVMPHLPERSASRLTLRMEDGQMQLYDSLRDDLINDLEQAGQEQFEQERMTFLARRSKLLQICSDPKAIDPTYDGTPCKLQALDLLLERLVGSGEKVVIWSYYRRSLDTLARRYAQLGVARYDGSVTDVDERRQSVRTFQEDDETMIFVANPAAAGAGLTLHRARFAVYESMSNQAAHYLQSLDRIHRRGQGREVEYFILLCDGTIEVDEYERLLSKEAAAADLLGDPQGAICSREMMLDELRGSLRR